MKYEYGNADICQEIDNSNKLVAKRSNSLPKRDDFTSSPGGKPNQYVRSARSSECVVACARVLSRRCAWCACARAHGPNIPSPPSLVRRVLRRIGIKFTRHPDILFRPTDCKRILQSSVFFANFVVQLFQICGITLIARRLRRNFAHNCVFHSR